MNVFRQVAMAAAVFALAACATPPRLENLKHPGADLQADTASCQQEAERTAKLEQLIRPPAFQDSCLGCQTQANRQLRTQLDAYGSQKRCMASKGWREVP